MTVLNKTKQIRRKTWRMSEAKITKASYKRAVWENYIQPVLIIGFFVFVGGSFIATI